jgi:hypothetical protein
MKAWEWLADRGFGKAAQVVNEGASDEPLVIQLHWGRRQDAAERRMISRRLDTAIGGSR